MNAVISAIEGLAVKEGYIKGSLLAYKGYHPL